MNTAAPATNLILWMERDPLRDDLQAPHRANIFRAIAAIRKT